MSRVEDEIQAMVDRETDAWDRQDAETLVSLFHPDMVWPWPPDADSHDPARMGLPAGPLRPRAVATGLAGPLRFARLVHNRRRTVRIEVSRSRTAPSRSSTSTRSGENRASGQPFHWKGRACKGYTKVGDRWLLIFHTGLLGLRLMWRPASRRAAAPPRRCRRLGNCANVWLTPS